MAKRQETIVSDDFTGEDIPSGEARTFRFEFEGTTYELDTNPQNYEAAKDRTLAELIELAKTRGRRTRGRAAARPARRTSSSSSSAERKAYLADVRAWARENGYQVADRARIPQDILDAYTNR